MKERLERLTKQIHGQKLTATATLADRYRKNISYKPVAHDRDRARRGRRRRADRRRRQEAGGKEGRTEEGRTEKGRTEETRASASAA